MPELPDQRFLQLYSVQTWIRPSIHIQVFLFYLSVLKFLPVILPVCFLFSRFTFLHARSLPIKIWKERAVYIINSYYMKISPTRHLKYQKISKPFFNFIPDLNRVSKNISFLMPNRIGIILYLP